MPKKEPETNVPIVEKISATQAQLGEGALWDAENNRFLWIDILGKQVHVYSPASEKEVSYSVPSSVGTVVPTTNKDVLLVALEDGIYQLNTNTQDVSKWLSIENEDGKLNRFNDGKCDTEGRFWVGTMNWEQTTPTGGLYMINADKTYEKKLGEITISNGIAWNKETGKMYYIDTPTKNLRSFSYDAKTGAISEESVLKTFSEGEGFPDGMTIDANGNLWVGMWNGGQVLCIDGQNGTVLHRIAVPAHNVTACAFGGPNLDTLYITTASVDMSKEETEKYPDAGSLFRTTIKGVKGVKQPAFKLNSL